MAENNQDPEVRSKVDELLLKVAHQGIGCLKALARAVEHPLDREVALNQARRHVAGLNGALVELAVTLNDIKRRSGTIASTTGL